MLKTLIAQIASGPVLVALDQQAVFQAALEGLMKDERAAEIAISTEIEATSDDDDGFWPEEDDGGWMSWLRPYKVKDGVLQIPVFGVLLNRFPYAFGSYATGYDYIRRAALRGENDGNVRGIALVSNSPGGMVAGCFELCDFLKDEITKPIRAFAADHAYSAAYAIASAADSISVTRSGGVGSVGVVTSHVDFSENLAKNGIKVTFIHAGKHKVEGNPYEALSADAKARIQARIDKLYGVFVSTVASNRDMSEESVRATEALCYDAEEAIEIGFADRIESAEDGLKDYVALLTDGEETMATPQGNVTGKKPGNEDEGAANAARAEGVEEGKAEGAAAERTRIASILTCANAEGREAAAIELALDEDTTFSATTANKMLGRMPKAEAPVADEQAKDEGKDDEARDRGGKEAKPVAKAGKDAFTAHMDADKHPEVGEGDGGEDASKSDDDKDTDSLLGSYKAAGGHVVDKSK